MKKILSESPLVIIVNEEYDCSSSIDMPIVQEALKDVHSDKRREEIIFTRSLLHQELNLEKLEKDPIGRPTLTKGDVSISHSRSLYGICFDPKKYVGLDIEIISEKPRRIKHKFQNNHELLFDRSDKELTRLWTLKEAVYKYLSRPGVLFAEQLFISKKEDHFQADYIVENSLVESIKLKSIDFGNYIISFTI